MASGRKYPAELRERSLRMVVEARAEDAGLSLHQAVLRIGPRVGVNPDTLKGWVKQARIDAGEIPGRSSDESARVRELEREVRELVRQRMDFLLLPSDRRRVVIEVDGKHHYTEDAYTDAAKPSPRLYTEMAARDPEEGPPSRQLAKLSHRAARAPVTARGYPTDKPVELLKTLIRQASRPGELVLDPFCGSGNLERAARELARRALLCDVDARFAAARLRLAAVALEATGA